MAVVRESTDIWGTGKPTNRNAYTPPKPKAKPRATPKPKATGGGNYSISSKVKAVAKPKPKAVAKKPATTTPDYSYITNAWKPLIDSAILKVKQHYVDRGLINSTAAGESQGQALAPITNGYAAAMEAAKSNDMARATDIWKSLNAIGASKGAITGELSDYENVSDLPWFTQMFNTNYLAPKASTGGQTGDPLEQGQAVERFKMFPGREGKNMAGQQMEQQASQFAQQMKAQTEARAAAEYARTHPYVAPITEDDSYGGMVEAVANPGALAGKPSQLLSLFMAKFGVDVEARAKAGDERAIALYKTLYPLTWQAKLGGTVVKPDAPAGISAASMWGDPFRSPLFDGPKPDVGTNTGYGVAGGGYGEHMKKLGLGKGVYWK